MDSFKTNGPRRTPSSAEVSFPAAKDRAATQNSASRRRLQQPAPAAVASFDGPQTGLARWTASRPAVTTTTHRHRCTARLKIHKAACSSSRSGVASLTTSTSRERRESELLHPITKEEQKTCEDAKTKHVRSYNSNRALPPSLWWFILFSNRETPVQPREAQGSDPVA